MRYFAKRALLGTTGIACALAAAQVSAQEADVAGATAEPDRAEAEGNVNEIVVTARKRSETVQDVPISIGVVTDEALASTGTSSLLEIQSVAPAVNFTKAPTGTEIGITIRGLGSAPGAPSFDSSVSLFVDGIFSSRAREFAAALFDVERIEVIKGTQAALLGKNTSLGGINLITRKPGNIFAANFRAGYEFEDGSRSLLAGIDLPIGDNLALRISGQTVDDEGFIRNVVSGDDAISRGDDAIRAVLRWDPTADLEVTALAQYNDIRLIGSPAEFVSLNDVARGLAARAGAPGTLDDRLDRRNAESLTTLGTVPIDDLDFQRYGLTVDYQLGDYTLTSITGYSTYEERNVTDPDFLPGDYWVRNYGETSDNFSQELRLVSPGIDPFNFVVGALYVRNDLDISLDNDVSYPFGPGGNLLAGRFVTDFDQTTETLSFFGQASLDLTERLSVTGGLRYTIEDKTVDLARTILRPGFYSIVSNPPYAPFTLSRKDKPFDYSAGVSFDVTPDVLLYASYGKGTKSGGFASTATLLDQSEYERETARTAEIGLKAQSPGRDWLFNLTGFRTVVDEFQVVTFNGRAFEIFNTDLESVGFEVEAHWYPIDELRLYLNNTFADAEDRDTGNPIPLAPKWSGTGGFNLRFPVGPELDFVFDGSVDYRSRRTYQQDPAAATVSQAYQTLNLAVGVDCGDGWALKLIGRNLLDSIAPSFAFPTPVVGTQSAIPERGRTVTLQLAGSF